MDEKIESDDGEEEELLLFTDLSLSLSDYWLMHR